jgi:hypothetical protein
MILKYNCNTRNYQSWYHPTFVYIVHYALITLVTFMLHDILVGCRYCHTQTSGFDNRYESRQKWSAIGVGVYAVLQMSFRLWQTKRLRFCVLYEGVWLCNTTLVIGALALLFRKPVITASFCITIGIDQLLWYIDILGWLLSGRFVIGVAKYLTWPSTPWSTKFTCTHHLWTLPLFLGYAQAPLSLHTLWLSFVIMVLHVSLSRYMIPLKVHERYLNVNLSHELWKDITFRALQISQDNPSGRVYLYRLFWRWHGFNILVYMFLLLLFQCDMRLIKI